MVSMSGLRVIRSSRFTILSAWIGLFNATYELWLWPFKSSSAHTYHFCSRRWWNHRLVSRADVFLPTTYLTACLPSKLLCSLVHLPQCCPLGLFFCIVSEKEGHVIVRWLKSETLFACNLRQMGQRCREICETNCSSTSSVFYITENQHALIWKFAWPKVKPNHLGMSVVAPYNLLIIKTD